MNWLSKKARKQRNPPSADKHVPTWDDVPPIPFADEHSPAEPCHPCSQKKGIRQFSLIEAPTLIAESDIPRLSTDVAFTVVDDTVVLYAAAHGVSHVLNPTAALIWASVDDERTVGEIIDELTAAAGAPRVVIATDVQTTLRRFLAAGIITIGDDLVRPQMSRSARWAATTRRILQAQAWPATFGPVRAAGADVVVRTNSQAVADQLREAFGALPTSPSTASTLTEIAVLDRGVDGPLRFRVYVGGEYQSAWDVPGPITTAVLMELNRSASETANGRLVLHAGAVEREGVVVVVAGDNDRGKTTLTARLVQWGFNYLSDEVVAVDAENLVALPYPKPLSVDANTLGLLGLGGAEQVAASQGNLDPHTLGSVSEGGQIGLIVYLAEGPSTTLIDTPATDDVRRLVEMLSCTFRASFEDLDALDALSAVLQRVPLLRLERAGLDDSCAQIESALGFRSAR